MENMINKIAPSSERTKVRKAIKDGLKIELTDDYDLVHKLCNKTLSRQNIQISIDKEEFYHQIKEFYPNNLLMVKATYEDKIEAVTVIFKDENNAYSKECRIQEFKKEFGATLKQGYQFRVIINPIKYYLFITLLKLKLKLKKINYVDPVERDRKLSETNLKV